MSGNQVILVDAHDQPMGFAEKHFAHEQGLRHRAISIVIVRKNSAGQIETLLQKRDAGKYHAPNCWSNSCCSHPMPGESIQAAASRRLKEELGIQLPLTYLDRLDYKTQVSKTMIEHEIDHIFIALDQGQVCQPNPVEVSDIAWVTLDRLKASLHSSQIDESFSPWCGFVMSVVFRNQAKVFSLMV
jgi:isopentenyl-diphosphate delta-isomerase